MAGLSLFVVLAVVVTGWLVLREDTYVAPRPDAPAPGVEPGPAASVLHQLEDAVRGDDPAAAAALAADGDAEAAGLLRAVVANAARIGVEDFNLRYLDPRGGVDADGRWRATVETSWRFAGFDREPSVADVEFVMRSDADGTHLAGIGGPDGVSPVWLDGPVQVERGPGTLVVAASDAPRYARLARAAVPVVRRVLPDWRSGLVVEVPASASALDAALGADPGRYAAIAAVTSGVGDSQARGVPVHVLVNPEVYGDLDARGAAVVMSHEATHVATQAPTQPDGIPVWLTEGYADYVALRNVDLPLSVTAAQVERRVRRDGLPSTLPTDRQFDTLTTHLGAAYEAAWLACRLLADRFGEDELTRFYTGLGPGDDVAAEFRSTFGLSLPAFTREWREVLRDLAA